MNEHELDLEPEPRPGENTPVNAPPPPAGEGDPPQTAFPPRAALTIYIQSWATPLVGVVMLVVGLLGGYFGRPLLAPMLTPTPTELAVEATSVSPSESSATTEPSVPEDQAARQQQLMEAVLSRTRHFKGDENASVTLIEFSDFQ